ncbi:MAG TPA: glycosyl hydrolase family 39 [Bryobacteraceae bacterium]
MPAAFGQSASPGPNSIAVNLNKTVIVCKSTPTLQVVVNPMLAQGSPIHDGTFSALKALGADYVRYVPWEPYPKLAVAELDPPTKEKTSWDFSLIDPYTKDFLAATEGHTTVMNFSTIPAWMFKTQKPVEYPSDPNQVFWNYTQGSEPVDPSEKQIAAYFARLVSWYTKGGFTDELGKFHDSGYHYKFPYWEVLNEVDMEHNTTPQVYTKRYDAIVEAVHKVSPDTKFMGLALAFTSGNPEWYEYFLNPANHQPGIPLDFISYHFYATPAARETIENWQYSFFNQADQFLAAIRFIESIRKRLSPGTRTDTNELGVILPSDNDEIQASKALPDRIPKLYWNAAAALYGYLFIEEAKLGIDVIGESQLVGYPSQFPSVSMMDWTNGKPNARYWVLYLLKNSFHPGDQLVETSIGDKSQIAAQAFVTPAGKKLLIINKSNQGVDVTLPSGVTSGSLETVDEATGDSKARSARHSGDILHLEPFAVAVLSYL